MAQRNCDLIVIGGGFFGAYLAAHAAKRGRDVVLLEANTAILQLASLVNQARIHNGYHYPRSILTGIRSRENYERFATEFADAVRTDFVHHYAIARHGSHVTPQQFALFCDRIGATYDEVRGAHHFDPDMVSAVYRVKEAAFDSEALRLCMMERLKSAGVELHLSTRAQRIERGTAQEPLAVHDSKGDIYRAPYILNCSYAAMNEVLAASGLPGVPLKLELVEIALLQLPKRLQGFGWTIMDGPFSGCLPYPARKATSLYHVRFSSHGSWMDDGQAQHRSSDRLERPSNCMHMIKDAARFVPQLAHSEHLGSAWVVRAKLPGSARTDSRPILFLPCDAAPGLFHVMGGKIDNVFDVLPAMSTALAL